MRKIISPYKNLLGNLLPLVEVYITPTRDIHALVDSGARMSMFNCEVADFLDIDIKTGQKIILSGVGGGITGYIHKVPVVVAGVKIPLKVCFSQRWQGLNILGRDNFFHKFIVTFDEVRRITILQSR